MCAYARRVCGEHLFYRIELADLADDVSGKNPIVCFRRERDHVRDVSVRIPARRLESPQPFGELARLNNHDAAFDWPMTANIRRMNRFSDDLIR